ncbi:hypothetical protein HG536_0H00470 [Torulaspora globosa]|uniref:Endoplasmic oxidoreductin-1 n=1 Tax=Torulaspora globosa TaxID=48254 RepID=A0A7G3ZMD6_9SACH|nr:uncharacterized protein HG536_0H00470 [Torulaspora globosa]QLL34672.1 hypothetical protein HG536_0H00470 [Torulaspora globosa]
MKLRSIIVALSTLSVCLGQGENSTGNRSEVDAKSVFQPPVVNNGSFFCTIDKDELVSPTCDVTFKEINEINGKIRKDLVSLVGTDFFKYFKLDLYKQCAFWDDNNGFCVNRACAVDVVEDWDNLPEYWQPEVLGGLDKVNGTSGSDDECKFLQDLCGGADGSAKQTEPDIDYCDIGDFINSQAVLVDLSANPERFTGYGGQESALIWSSIYRENCFSPGEMGQSLAKSVFYRLVSGLHASIATHLSNDHLNTETGKWEPDLELFMARVGNFPERVANVYFNYAVVSKALWKIKPYLSHLSFCNSYNQDVKSMIMNILSRLDSNVFNEDLIFEDELSSKVKDDFRARFKNVTKIMDCVHCDRCRLWGKVQTTGYATSLKILFELDDGDEESKQQVVDKLTKYELIALFNTFDRLSKSIESINNFERLYEIQAAGGKLASFFQNNNFFKLLKKARNSIKDSVQAINSSINSSSSEDERPVFADLRMPEKSAAKNTEQIENKWKKAWHTETHNVLEALKFIYRSYLDLPRNLWHLLLSTSNRLWNKFLGIQYLSEEDDSVMYKLDII